MDEPVTQLSETVTISVERMMRFCYLAKIMSESAPYKTIVLTTYLTRFGTMLFETASFLYSLFEDNSNSINLSKIWGDFDHPFNEELREFETKLQPFKEELRLVRNSVGFHGSLSRSRENAGLGIFDVKSPRGREFSKIIYVMQKLALKMIEWYIKDMDEAERPRELWQEFVIELQGQSAKLPKPLHPRVA